MPDTSPIDFETLLKDMSDGIFVCRKSGEIVYANAALGTLLGYPKRDLADRNMAKDMVDRELEWQALTSLMEQGSPIVDYEIKMRRADGSKATMALSAGTYRDAKGMPIGIAGVVRDISTRKGVEDDLREKAFRSDIINRISKSAGAGKGINQVLKGLGDDLRKLVPFEHISLGVTEEEGRHVELLVLDPADHSRTISAGKVLYEGSVVEKLKYGKDAVIVEKDATRKPFSEMTIMGDEDISALLAVPLKSRGRVFGSLNIAHSKPGEYNWESAEILQTIADQMAGMIDSMMLLRSLETKVNLHESLLSSGIELQKAITTEQIYAAIASHIRDIVHYKDLSFYLVDWQSRTVIPVYAVGEYTDEILAAPGDLDQGIVAYVAKSGKAEFVDDVDVDPRAAEIPDTPTTHDAMLAIPLIGSDGVLGVLELYRPFGQVFSVSDLEAGMLFAQQASVALANSQLVAKLQEAKKEIELLNDLMFHDINNYNFATLNYIETAVKSGELPEKQKAHLEKALALIRQNSKLIGNVKKLTKIGVLGPEDLEHVNLKDVLTKASSSLAHASPDKSLSVDLKLPDTDDVFVKANSLLDELFVNLLSNSMKYDPHDEVEIDVECRKVLDDGRTFWKVTIADRGPGITDEKKQVLFQKYVRLKPESSVSGTGLGLSIVRALADKFQGRVWVEDRVQGKSELGAKFCVELPAAKKPS